MSIIEPWPIIPGDYVWKPMTPFESKAYDELNKPNATEQLRPGDDLNKGGVKFDAGKIRVDLVPVEAIEAVAVILGIGAAKYEARNWEKGMDWSRPYGAALRHLFAWFRGENLDPDTGKSHLWLAATELFFLICYEKWGVGKDDRPLRKS